MSVVTFSTEARPSRRIDFVLAFTVLVIAYGGVLAIRSATHGQATMSQYPEKQAVGIVIGLVAMIALALSDYTRLIPRIATWAYALNLAFLVLVVVHGHSSHGAQRWIPLGPIDFQPSELAKIIVVVCLALHLYERQNSIREMKTVLGSLFYIAVPMLLIFKQPDLGTGLVILCVWFGMISIAGAKWQHLLAILLAGLALFSVAWHTPLIKDYQKQRLTSFINPASDPHDTGYHLHQSEIAIGSGGVNGQGYMRGMQSNGHFIPEQHTDFIFTIVGEETGLLGCCLLIALYALMIERCLSILVQSEDMLGRLLIAGIVTMFSFHIIVNIGMTIGIMPVTGVPLPFFSYGLSALVVGMAAIGLVLSVAAHDERGIFSKV